MKENIDNGLNFDWGRASLDYAKYRDIYPESMYKRLNSLGVGKKGAVCLDIGTGTGVLPRNMYKFGAKFTGMDISPEQTAMAKELSAGMNINYVTGDADALPFEDGTFDSVSAVQCWGYFDKEKLIPELYRVLKTSGVLAVAFMQWLPKEDAITDMSLKLIKKYNPQWNAFDTRSPVNDEDILRGGFEKYEYVVYNEKIPFTYDKWNGRMRASRGVDASLSPEKASAFSQEHLEKLREMTKDNFTVLHKIQIFTFKKA